MADIEDLGFKAGGFENFFSCSTAEVSIGVDNLTFSMFSGNGHTIFVERMISHHDSLVLRLSVNRVIQVILGVTIEYDTLFGLSFDSIVIKECV